jgi:hypothetical protein
MYVYVRVCTCIYFYVRVGTCIYVYERICACNAQRYFTYLLQIFPLWQVKSTDNFCAVNFNSYAQLIIMDKFLFYKRNRTIEFRSEATEIISFFSLGGQFRTF